MTNVKPPANPQEKAAALQSLADFLNDHIDGKYHRLNMAIYLERHERETFCETTGCLAGWECFRHKTKPQLLPSPQGYPNNTYAQAAAYTLGLEPTEAWALFQMQTPPDRSVRALPYGGTTLTDAVTALHRASNLAAKGEPITLAIWA